MGETKWLDTDITIKYRDLFGIIENNNVLKSVLNPDKLTQAAFSVTTSLFTKENGKSPYDNDLQIKSIQYIPGDATCPKVMGNKIIGHVCNDIGAWGQGFVLAVTKRWRTPQIEYKKWIKESDDSLLGLNQYVNVEPDIIVANMVAQHGIMPIIDSETLKTIPPIRYDALRKCLADLSKMAIETHSSVHLPKIGAGLAGGDWKVIEAIINEELIVKGIITYVYIWEEK